VVFSSAAAATGTITGTVTSTIFSGRRCQALSRPGWITEQLEKQRDHGETELLGNATDRIVLDRTGFKAGLPST
jgi:hypothetical protein